MTFPLAIPLAMTLPGNPVSWFNGSTRISLTNEQLGMFTKKDHPWNTLWGQHFYLLVVEFTVFCCFVFFFNCFSWHHQKPSLEILLGGFFKASKISVSVSSLSVSGWDLQGKVPACCWWWRSGSVMAGEWVGSCAFQASCETQQTPPCFQEISSVFFFFFVNINSKQNRLKHEISMAHLSPREVCLLL